MTTGLLLGAATALLLGLAAKILVLDEESTGSELVPIPVKTDSER